jgi:hypothetical protein
MDLRMPHSAQFAQFDPMLHRIGFCSPGLPGFWKMTPLENDPEPAP